MDEGGSEGASGAETGRGRTLDRRAYLRLLGAGVAGGAATATGGTAAQPSAGVQQEEFRYDRVYDVVSDLGADPIGGTPIDDVLADHVESNTMLRFPSGTYRVTKPVNRFGQGVHDFAMVAEGDATFRLETAVDYWFSLGGPGSYNILYDGFTHDVRPAEIPSRLQLRPEDGLIVRNVTHTGRHEGVVGPFRFDIQREDGRGLVENVVAKEGAPDHMWTVGLFVGPAHVGRLDIENCDIWGFPNNGIYQANGSPGVVNVTGGVYRNNNIANVRVAGSNSVIRGVSVVIDEDFSRNELLGTNVRGIRLTNGADILVEDCTVEVLADAPSDGAVVANHAARSPTVRNTAIRLNGHSVVGVRAKRPSFDGPEGRAITCSGLQIVGDAPYESGNENNRAAVFVVDRPGSVIDSSCIQLTGLGRNGVHLVRSPGSEVTDTAIEVTGRPILQRKSPDTVRRNVSTEGVSCSFPDE